MNTPLEDKNGESQNITTKELDIKPRDKAFADKILNEPEISQTQAYKDTHRTNSDKTAVVEASKLIRKPNVVIYMKRHEQMAKNTIVNIMKDKSIKPDTRLKAATDILDRNIGKSIQRTESHNTSLNLNIEASKELSDNFTAFLKGNTVS